MASGAKRKTTMAKLNREHRLRERRQDKQARKDARKLAAAEDASRPQGQLTSESAPPAAGAPAPDVVIDTPNA